jgi:hypothetical protein
MTTASTTKSAAKERPVFTLRLRPEAHVAGVPALRALLKVALRRYGLRCISAWEDNGENEDARPNTD